MAPGKLAQSSALKGETVPDSLPATPKSPPTRRVPPREQSYLSGKESAQGCIPKRWLGRPDEALGGLEGVPGLPGAPQDEAGLTRKFDTSHVGGA